MNSIDQVFSDDFHKFVLQDQPIVTNPFASSPRKKFELDPPSKEKKTKKKKEDSPWLPKKPNQEEEEE